MAAVETAPWARGRTEEEFRDFLIDLPGVTLVGDLYTSDRARTKAPLGVSGGRVGPSAEPAAAREVRLPPALATVVEAAGLTVVDGPRATTLATVGSLRYWIFQDERPIIGGRYLATFVGGTTSISPDLIAALIRLAEDNGADRCLLVGVRVISAAAQAFARGRPVLLVSGAETTQVRRELRGSAAQE